VTLRVHPDEIVAASPDGVLSTHPTWQRVRLAAIAEVLNGFAFPSSSFATTGTMPLIRIRDVGRANTGTWYSGPYDPEYVVEPGSLVIGMDGDFRADIWRGPPALLNQRVCKVSVRNPDQYDPHFLRYVLPGYLEAVNRLTSAVTVKHLSSETVKALPLPLPPRREQQRIVAAIEEQFSRLDAGVAAVARVRKNLTRMRASVLRAAVLGQLKTEPVESEPLKRGAEPPRTARRAGRLWGSGEVPLLTEKERRSVPDRWEWVKVGEIGFDPVSAVQVGPMSMRSAEFADSGVPVLNVGSVQWDWIDETKIDHLPERLAASFARYRIQSGDVLFTRSGTVGRSAVATDHHNGWLMTFHLLRVRPDPAICNSEYLRMVFEGAPHVRRQAAGAAIGTTRAGFNTHLLAELDIPLPPLREQAAIVGRTAELLADITPVRADILDRRARRLRSSILSAAFTGRLAPQDTEDESASVLLDSIVAERSSPNSREPSRKPSRDRGELK